MSDIDEKTARAARAAARAIIDRVQTFTIADLVVTPGLAARPDVLEVAVGATVEGQGPSRATAILRDAAAVLVEHLAPVHPGAHVSARRLRLGGGTSDKAAKQDRVDVHLDGVLRLPLGEALDFWERADLAARVTEALAAAAIQLSKQKPAVILGWREPQARMADEEPFRAKLLDRVAASLRALGPGAGAGSIAIADLPLEVVQTTVSLEEVRLTLGGTDPRSRVRG